MGHATIGDMSNEKQSGTGISGGRVFKPEGTAKAMVLEQEETWHILETNARPMALESNEHRRGFGTGEIRREGRSQATQVFLTMVGG